MSKSSRQYSRTKDWPYHISSGGVVRKEISGDRRYAILYRNPDADHPKGSWHLPKGTLRFNETLENCALREIKEESGLDASITGYLGAYQAAWVSRNGIKIDKTTHYFLCKWVEGDGATMDDEHDELQWHQAKDAISRLCKEPKHEEEMIKRAEKYLTMNINVS